MSVSSDLFVRSWGEGVPVILVHGSLATGEDEWQCQRELAAEGFRLLVPDRRGYGSSAAAPGEDYLADAQDILGLIGENGRSAHLVGHSYGGLGVLFAALQKPEAVLSMTLLEAPTFMLAQDAASVRPLLEALDRAWNRAVPDDEWVVGFLEAVGSDPAEMSPELVSAAVPLVPVLRHGRRFSEAEPPVEELARAPFPKLVVSGGHNDGWEAMCDVVARRIGARRITVTGAGHEIQFVGPALNAELLDLWRSAPIRPAQPVAIPS